MAKRRDNMLEAFQASAIEDATVAAAGAGVPETPRARSVSPGSALSGAGLSSAEERQMILPMGVATFLLLQVALVMLAFFAGKVSSGSAKVLAEKPGEMEAGDVDLAQGEGARGPGSREWTAGGDRGATEDLTARPAGSGRGRRPGGGTQLTPRGGAASAPAEEALRSDNDRAPRPAPSQADLAFKDPTNRFTLLVYTADDTPFGWEMAWVSHAHLANLGFDVIQPQLQGSRVLLHVGAFSKFDAAQAVQGQVVGVSGPGGTDAPYAGAYVVNIRR